MMSKLLKSADTWSYFNGSTSYIQYADNDVFSFTDGVNDIPFEIEFDMNPSVTTGTFVVIQKGSGINFEWSIRIINNNLYIYCWKVDASAYIRVYSPLNINTSHHIKITYNGSKLWTGVKIYFDNIEQITTNSSSGIYTGMTNTPATVSVGSISGLYFLNGYLRNLRIKKNNQLVFFATLQDTNDVSKDVIGGLVHNAGTLPTVVNKLESERWAYFNGVTSALSIGTTSTLGWMNSGIFNMSFDLKLYRLQIGDRPIVNAVTSSERGFQIYTTGTQMGYYFSNGTGGGWAFSGVFTPLLGVYYKITIIANGSQMRMIVTNDVISIYDTGFLNITFVPNSTTSYYLGFSNKNGVLYQSNCQLRNFKIFTDTAGTQPFLSLPFQNPDAIAVDTVGGLVGTNTGVYLINKMENVLKSQNNWSFFNGTTSYIQYADNDVFSFTDGVNDIPFEVEFDLYTGNATAMILGKRNASNREYQFYIQTYIYIQLYTDSTNYIGIRTTNGLSINSKYRIKLTYDGSKLYTGCKIYINNVLVTAITNSSGGIYSGMTNTTAVPIMGKIYNNTYYLDGYLRNLKIKKNNQLVFFAPLQDSTAVSKDVIGGLVHNAGTLPVVVNKLESERWAYFNGVNSSASIGTTSTLGWMNSGVFNMEITVKFLIFANDRRLFQTGTSGYAFSLYMYASNLKLIWFINTVQVFSEYLFISPVIGKTYRIIIKGDGVNIYYTTYESDGTVNKTNEPGGTPVAFVPNSTTSSYLSFNTVLVSSFQIKNFKIFTDFAGTIPFMSLPMQNAEDVITDRITGLQGTATAVSIINNNENVLRSKNLWSKFIGTSGNASIGTTSTLGWMNSGIFNLSFEINIPVTVAGKYLLHTAQAVTHKGFYFYTWTNLIQLYWVNGTYLINGLSIINPYVTGTSYKINFRGDGVKYYYTTYNPDGTINQTNEPTGTSISYTPFATTSYPLSIRRTGTSEIECYVRNVKIFTDFAGTIPFMNLPMTDGGNIMKDVQSGLQGTATNVKVVEV